MVEWSFKIAFSLLWTKLIMEYETGIKCSFAMWRKTQGATCSDCSVPQSRQTWNNPNPVFRHFNRRSNMVSTACSMVDISNAILGHTCGTTDACLCLWLYICKCANQPILYEYMFWLFPSQHKEWADPVTRKIKKSQWLPTRQTCHLDYARSQYGHLNRLVVCDL